MTTSRLVVLAMALAASGCEDPPPPIHPTAHSADVEAWHEWRHADLMQPDGWLSLPNYFVAFGDQKLGRVERGHAEYHRGHLIPREP